MRSTMHFRIKTSISALSSRVYLLPNKSQTTVQIGFLIQLIIRCFTPGDGDDQAQSDFPCAIFLSACLTFTCTIFLLPLLIFVSICLYFYLLLSLSLSLSVLASSYLFRTHTHSQFVKCLCVFVCFNLHLLLLVLRMTPCVSVSGPYVLFSALMCTMHDEGHRRLSIHKSVSL